MMRMPKPSGRGNSERKWMDSWEMHYQKLMHDAENAQLKRRLKKKK